MLKLCGKNKEFLIPFLFGILLIVLSIYHSTFEEWDGVMQLFAGRELISGGNYTGWTSHYWPPLYPLLVGLLDQFLPGFVAAKTISHLSGVILLYVVYLLAIELSGNKTIAISAQLFLAVNPFYLLSSLQAENHMLDSLFFVLALHLLVKVIKKPFSYKLLIYLGIVAGLAGLSRYTSYVLSPTVLISLLYRFNWKQATVYFLIFFASFSCISLPWWWMNTIQNGSPISTWQYLNIGYGISGKDIKWWWRDHAEYKGIWDILRALPLEYIENFAKNILRSFLHILAVSGMLFPFVVTAIWRSLQSFRGSEQVALYSGLVLYILLVSQAFVFEQVFLSWGVILTVITTNYLFKSDQIFSIAFGFMKKKWLIPILIFCSMVVTTFITYTYLKNQNDNGYLTDQKELVESVEKYDQHIKNKTIMASHPARAYELGSNNFLMIPFWYDGSIDGLPLYRDLEDGIVQHAPQSNLDSIEADYLIYDRYTSNFLPQYSFLFIPTSSKIPSNFKLVFYSEEVVVYEISD